MEQLEGGIQQAAVVLIHQAKLETVQEVAVLGFLLEDLGALQEVMVVMAVMDSEAAQVDHKPSLAAAAVIQGAAVLVQIQSVEHLVVVVLLLLRAQQE